MRETEERAIGALLSSVEGLVARTADLTRPARIAAVLPDGVSASVAVVLREVLGCQRADGGWAGVEESLWCLSALAHHSGTSQSVVRGREWLSNQRATGGGWGRALRESPNYVTTALAVCRVRDLAAPADADWLERTWHRDLVQDVTLAYKGALYLKGMRCTNAGTEHLLEQTAAYLTLEQNDDGGFGPWRGHPIGSDPWSTGMCLVGLCAFPELADPTVVERAVQWLDSAQLESGLWACHFIDEGTAYAYWGLSEAIKFLEAS